MFWPRTKAFPIFLNIYSVDVASVRLNVNFQLTNNRLIRQKKKNISILCCLLIFKLEKSGRFFGWSGLLIFGEGGHFHNISGYFFSFTSVLNTRRNTFAYFLQCTPNCITLEIFFRCWRDIRQISQKLELNFIFLLHYLFLKKALSEMLE